MTFWRKKIPEVDLTNEAYSRWLRAQRPPLTWFLARAEDEQEAMATLGDQHLQDLCVGIGYAVHNPQAAEAAVGMANGSADAEVNMVQQLAARVLSGIVQKASQAPQRPKAAPPATNGTNYVPPRMRPTGRKPEGSTP